MLEAVKLLATLCCGVFFGAALYISLVQHPAALETGNEFAAHFFPPMYGRAAAMQASLAVVGCAAAIAALNLMRFSSAGVIFTGPAPSRADWPSSRVLSRLFDEQSSRHRLAR
jgi:hypothetical protein